MQDEKIKALLEFVPENSLPILKEWFLNHNFQLKITKERSTKHGDFRAARFKIAIPIITVNRNLNQYAFLITLTHEFAHFLVWKNYKRGVKPHGLEWKQIFSNLLQELLLANIFPQNIKKALTVHAKNPAASSSKDMVLVKELKKYDLPSNSFHLIDLKEGALFSLKNKRIFKKGKKRRTRFLCQEVATKKEYLVHGVAEVVIVDNEI